MTDKTEPRKEDPMRPLVPTDPAELFALFGRFISAIFLMFLTIVLVMRHGYILALATSVVATFAQRAAIQTYRRMRDERTAALEALEAQSSAS